MSSDYVSISDNVLITTMFRLGIENMFLFHLLSNQIAFYGRSSLYWYTVAFHIYMIIIRPWKNLSCYLRTIDDVLNEDVNAV